MHITKSPRSPPSFLQTIKTGAGEARPGNEAKAMAIVSINEIRFAKVGMSDWFNFAF